MRCNLCTAEEEEEEFIEKTERKKHNGSKQGV